MKKIFLRGYLKKNLGDDLFFKVITERYNKSLFYTFSNYKNIESCNLKVIKRNIFIRIIDILFLKLFNNFLVIEKIFERKCDLTIVIGGSIFVENINDNNHEDSYLKSFCNSKHKNYMIGLNFGPYKTKKYKHKVENILLKNEDVCFRDSKSYELFKECENVRKAPDILFSLNLPKFNTNNRNVIISVIDCEYKNRPKKVKIKRVEYENKIVELINKLNSMNYNIILTSFCEFEGDEIACERIEKKCELEHGIKCNKYYYKGDINEALSVLANSKLIIGTRFHANVIGLAYNKVILPISYNWKTDNMLNDINYNGLRIKIDEIEKFNVDENIENILNYKCDVSKIKKESEKHFYILDQVLLGENNE